MLKKEKIPHQVLNAKFHDKEAEIIAQAGKYKSVTIATNMAGRGTDIMLGGNLEYTVKEELAKKGYSSDVIEMAITPITYDNDEVTKAQNDIKQIEEKLKPQFKENRDKVVEAGGLKIIGSERHESRRIDNQLRGRSGRQGDIGQTRFYISLEDDLMKLFGSDRMKAMVETLGLPDDIPLEQRMLSSAIETAQKKVEGQNYSIRKNVLEYDDVMNTQREIIYSQRREVLNTEDISKVIFSLVESKVNKIVEQYFTRADNIDDVDFETLNIVLKNLFGVDNFISKEDITELDDEKIKNAIMEKIKSVYDNRHEEAKKLNSEEILNSIERYLILNTVNEKWIDHIDAISALKDGIGLRAYGQSKPIDEYKIESFDMFEELVNSIQEEAIRAVFSVRPKSKEEMVNVENKEANTKTILNMNTNEDGSNKKEPVKRSEKKVGRNEPCPCGSGKKYKQCCGK